LTERPSERRYTEGSSQNVDTDKREIEKSREGIEMRSHCGNVNG
jgi:hypothetical protein